MADDLFEHPRLAAVYDALDPDRSDLDVYAAMVTELGARRVLDVGCGTGTFALMLADGGVDVVAVDPAGASLDVARGKRGSERVRWVHGDATAVPEDLDGRVDLAVMTANVAQAIVDEQDWSRTLGAVRRCLRTGGHLVFETRRPERRGWEEWTREQSETLSEVPGYGSVRHWVQLTGVDLPLVSFEAVRVFGDQTLISTSTLRFRSETEVSARSLGRGTRSARCVRRRTGRVVSWSSSHGGPGAEIGAGRGDRRPRRACITARGSASGLSDWERG